MSSPDRLGFERQVRDAVAHLHDPGHLQAHPLTRFLRAESSPRPSSLGRALHQAILDAVESLRPTADLSPSARASRSYQILNLRYVEALEVSQVLDRLSLSQSLYYVELQRAIEGLSAVLSERWGVGKTGGVPGQRSERATPDGLVGSVARDRETGRTEAKEEALANLPVQLTSFVGREREMAEARRLLSTTRLLTLTGTGGCGKTRLAYQVASDVLDEYPDGVWVAELASLADPALVPQAAGFALDVREQPGQPMLATLAAALRPKSLLLVLDNCEHLLDACARLVDALLHGCPRLRILTTSRETLGIAGETSYRVPSLSLPDPRQLPPLTSLTQYEAIRLFVDRAVAALPTFEVTNQNARAVAQVCWRLDGIPLAIELAAARVRGLSVEQIASRLDDCFRLLTGGSRTALRRQQTLRATIDWSHDLLSPAERVVLRRLSVFAGGCDLEAAEAVCAGVASEASIEKTEVLDLVLRLVDRSLVVADTQADPVRYRLLETIRQYAGEKLFESGEVASARDRHLECYLALAEREAPELAWRVQRGWWERLEQELDNVRAALEWSLGREEGADTAVRLWAALGAFGTFWAWSRRPAEVRARLEPVLARPGGEPTARIKTLRLAATTASLAGDWRQAREWHEEALALAREVGDKPPIVYSLIGLSCVASDLGNWVEARSLQEEALGIARRLGDREIIGAVLTSLTDTLWLQGEDAAARSLAEEELAIGRALGDGLVVAESLRQLGLLALGEGDPERARALGEAGLAQSREAGYATGIADGLRLLGDVARATGDSVAAEALYRDAVAAIQRVAGNRFFITSYLISLAGLWSVQGRAREAVRLYGAVHGWLEMMGMPVPWFPPRGWEQGEAAARAALDPEAFAAAWAEGQAMSLDQAVEYALAEETGRE